MSEPHLSAKVIHLPERPTDDSVLNADWDHEYRFRRRVTTTYRIAFFVACLAMLTLSAHLATQFDWVPSVLAVGISLVCFRWFLTSFVDDRFNT